MTMSAVRPLALALGMSTLLAACGTMGASQPQGLPSLQPQPVSPVSSSQLPPLTPAPGLPGQPLPGSTEVAGLPPAATPGAAPAGPVGRADLSGAWTLASAGENCQLVMSLTSWTGGQRASTRGCSSDELRSVGAWDLEGNDVVLKDASGSQVARLSATADQRFSGQTSASGRGVQFFR
jgi:hypothetical protein